jgi:superfamily II DNA/RNA helicase
MSGIFSQHCRALHPLVTAGLVTAGIEHLTTFQQNLFGAVATSLPDMVAESHRDCGHLVSMVCWAAHALLSETGDEKVGFILAKSDVQVARLLVTIQKLGIHKLGYFVIEHGDDSTPSIPKGSRLLIATTQTFRRCRDLLTRCLTVVVEDVATMNRNLAVDLVELAVKANPMVSLCLLASLPPCKVDTGVRYLLRRSNRRYLPVDRRPSANFTSLLCHDQREREELALRICDLGDLRRVLVMTHNKEVRDLRQTIADGAKLNALAVHRSTPATDRQRTLSDFIQSPFAVLVTMDAFTGIDLVDVDAVINFYPPQKSMPDPEWTTFISCLQTTGDPARPTLVVSIAAPDDITMTSFFLQKLRLAGPILNVAPSHPDFDDIVRNPEAALMVQGPDSPPRLTQLTKELQAKDARQRTQHQHGAVLTASTSSASGTPTMFGAGGKPPAAGAAAANSSTPSPAAGDKNQQQGGYKKDYKPWKKNQPDQALSPASTGDSAPALSPSAEEGGKKQWKKFNKDQTQTAGPAPSKQAANAKQQSEALKPAQTPQVGDAAHNQKYVKGKAAQPPPYKPEQHNVTSPQQHGAKGKHVPPTPEGGKKHQLPVPASAQCKQQPTKPQTPSPLPPPPAKQQGNAKQKQQGPASKDGKVQQQTSAAGNGQHHHQDPAAGVKVKRHVSRA